MYELNIPDVNPFDIFSCLTSDYPLSRLLQKQEIRDTIIFFHIIYKIKGSTASLNTLHKSKITFHTTTTKDEMEKIYKNRLVKSKPGRVFYKSIMDLAINKTCPLCSLRLVSTLDHYLPKAHYPQYALSLINLYPACIECNKSKLDIVSLKKSEQTFHPYFDKLKGITWLSANYHPSPSPKVIFYINSTVPEEFSLRERIEYHFKKLGLGELYSTYAANELSSIKFDLRLIFKKKGAIGVKNHLYRQYISASKVNKNSWKSVLYLTLYSSSTFYTEEFNKIADMVFP